MKVATLYRKDGKVILETENDALAQVATDSPQDVVVEQDVSPQGIAALLADHARLQEDAERLDWLERFVRKAYIYGASFDYAQALEGERGGYRFMARHRLDARHPTLRAAIDAAKAVRP